MGLSKAKTPSRRDLYADFRTVFILGWSAAMFVSGLMVEGRIKDAEAAIPPPGVVEYKSALEACQKQLVTAWNATPTKAATKKVVKK